MGKITNIFEAETTFKVYGEHTFDKAAYHRLIKKYHPDKEGNKEAAQNINVAWAILKNAPIYIHQPPPKPQAREPQFQKPIVWPWDMPHPQKQKKHADLMKQRRELYEMAAKMMRRK